MSLTTVKQEVRCSVCKEKYDDQFISNYETLDQDHFKIKVCEDCAEEKVLYDEEKDMRYIEHITGDYYSSHDLANKVRREF